MKFSKQRTGQRMMLNEFDFSDNQVEAIREHIRRNSQIHQTKLARDSVFKFIDKYGHFFDDDFRNWYDSKRASRMWMTVEIHTQKQPFH